MTKKIYLKHPVEDVEVENINGETRITYMGVFNGKPHQFINILIGEYSLVRTHNGLHEVILHLEPIVDDDEYDDTE